MEHQSQFEDLIEVIRHRDQTIVQLRKEVAHLKGMINSSLMAPYPNPFEEPHRSAPEMYRLGMFNSGAECPIEAKVRSGA